MGRILLFLATMFVAGILPANGQIPIQPARSGEPFLYVTSAGEGDEVVVVLHGGPGISHDYLRPEWDRLSGPERRVVYYDQRGCGRSGEAAPYGWREDVADLARVIEQESPDAPVILAGSSWGSWLALLYAMEHPDDVAAIVLSGTPPWWHNSLSVYSEKLLRNIRRSRGAGRATREDVEAHAARADSVNRGLATIRRVRVDSSEARKYVPKDDSLLAFRFARPPQVMCGDAHAARAGLWYDISPIDSLSAIDIPTLLVWGREDRMLDGQADPMAEYLPDARVLVLDGTGHDPWFDQGDLFFAAVESFLTTAGER